MRWLEETADVEIKVPAVVLGEVQVGIERLRAGDPSRALALDAWLDRVALRYEVLPVDGPVFRGWAKLMTGRPQSLAMDGMIAATAEVHGLVVVTRNVRDFAVFGSRVFDPFGPAAG